MIKKRIIATMLSVAMLFSLGACNVKNPDETGGGGKTTLPDYDAKSEELSMKIAGWVIPKDLNDTQIQYIKDSGITVLQAASAGSGTLSIDISSELSDENKAIMQKCKDNGLSLLLHVGGKDASKLAYVSNVTAYDAVQGLCIDEPNKSQIDQIAARVDSYNRDAGTKDLFVNLYPSLWSGLKTDFDGNYSAYLEYFYEKVLSKVTAGEKWLSADRYPLTYDTKGEKCLDTGWLSDVEAVALLADKHENVKTNFFIQTMPYGGVSNSGAKAGSRDRVPSYEDVRMQEYALLTFGYDMISCFCYGSPVEGNEFLDRQVAMIDRSGERTDIYYSVQKANKEILAFDHVIKQFAWKGVFTNDAGKTTADKQRTQNSSFAGLTSRMSIAAIDCLAEVYSSADTLFGYFTDAEENAGFMLVNYNETSEEITDNVTLRFNPDYKFNKALCYIGGVKTVLDVKDNALDITLGVGEGVFVIPYCG